MLVKSYSLNANSKKVNNKSTVTLPILKRISLLSPRFVLQVSGYSFTSPITKWVQFEVTMTPRFNSEHDSPWSRNMIVNRIFEFKSKIRVSRIRLFLAFWMFPKRISCTLYIAHRTAWVFCADYRYIWRSCLKAGVNVETLKT